jgi:hypothetical protein
MNRKWVLFCIFLFLTSYLCSQEYDLKNKTFISLGSFCGPALQIKQLGLREAAYPLDWMLSVNGKKLIELLDEDFAFFTDECFLKTHPTSGILLHLHYCLEFTHEEYTIGPFRNMEQLKEKYNRRIERFRKLRNCPNKIYFIRASWPLSINLNYSFADPGNLEISEEYAHLLFAALKRFFPDLDFELFIFNNKNEQDFEEVKVFDHIKIFTGNNPCQLMLEGFKNN